MEDLFISQQELTAIKNAKTKIGLAAAQAEKAIAEHKAAELEYRNTFLMVMVKYKLEVEDSIDENTGKVLKKAQAEVVHEDQK